MRRNIRNLSFSVPLLMLLAGAGSAFAAPTCQTANDPDGDGWGYENGASCRVASNPGPSAGGSSCVDTAPTGDGWGWNGTSSCRVTTTPTPSGGTCIDTAPTGDGWGWNGTSSCRVTTTPTPSGGTCIDTAPTGDGWGWNGTSSCRVTTTPTPSGGTCIDTAPTGDGWGWNGTASCRVGRVFNDPIPTVCEDTPPLNDGWGWNGTTGCRLEIEYPEPSACVDANLDGVYTNGVSTCEPTLMNYRKTYTLNKSNYRPVIDGKFDYYSTDWNDSTILYTSNNLLLIDGTQPLDGTVYLKHYDDYLYIKVSQYIPTVYTDSPSSTRLYDDDGWELYFNLGNERGTEYDINDRHLMGDWGLLSNYGRPRTLNGLNAQRDLYPTVLCGSRGNIRTCEMRFYLPSLGVEGPVPQDIGFDLHINNDNDGGERDSKMGLCGPSGVDEAWRNPSKITCAIRFRF